MLIWGSRGKTVEAGDAGNRLCPVCKENRHFRYVLSYKMNHIWYLLRWSTSKSWSTVCDTCNCVFPSEPPVIADAGVSGGAKAKSPIPFFDRWGWAIIVTPLLLLLIAGLIGAQADKAEDAKMVAAPKVGDIYIVEIDKFADADALTDPKANLGILRVSAVSGTKAVFDLPKMVTNKMSMARRDIRDGAASKSDYYDGQIEKSVSELTALHDAGSIREVER